MIPSDIPTKSYLRQRYLLERNQLPQETQTKKSLLAAKHLVTHPSFLGSRTLAAYWPIQGELNPLFIFEKAWSLNKRCYLPHLHPSKFELMFAEYQVDDPLIQNQYGIPEPHLAEDTVIKTEDLDLVLLPLVAFDSLGNRLGMGKGYYDATFAFTHKQFTILPKRPLLMGLGYAFQSVTQVPVDTWDVPLDGIVTETGVILFKN